MRWSAARPATKNANVNAQSLYPQQPKNTIVKMYRLFLPLVPQTKEYNRKNEYVITPPVPQTKEYDRKDV